MKLNVESNGESTFVLIQDQEPRLSNSAEQTGLEECKCLQIEQLRVFFLGGCLFLSLTSRSWHTEEPL